MSENLCACGCGKLLPVRKDGKNQRYIKNHSGVGKLVDAICKHCGKPIRVHQWRLDKFGYAFCNNECSGAYHSQSALHVLICEQCGNKFSITRSRKQYDHVYCSPKCAHEAAKNKRVNKIDTQCSYCGKPLKRHPSAVGRSEHAFCDKECRKHFIKGINNPSYTSGVGRRRIYGDNWRTQRRLVLKRDNNCCQRCGITPKNKRHLHVHHITPFYTFKGDWLSANVLTNLIALCYKCHKKAERGETIVQRKLL